MTDLVIRPVGVHERAAWEPLWKGYQTFYEVALSDEVTATTWARLHDPRRADVCRSARTWTESSPASCTTCFTAPAGRSANYCYLQDLFVAENARKRGIGRALIEAVENEARAAGASRVYWLTKEDNATARALYDQVAERSGFIQYRKLF